VGVLGDFPPEKRGLFGRRAQCNGCNSDRVKAQYRRNPAPAQARSRKSNLAKYGMTVADYDRMLVVQSGLCASCDDPMTVPHIDHDHKTGHVRAMLCTNCNIAIGHLKDDPQRCVSAAWYLMQHENVEVSHD
jgi:hypothetical protein